MIGRPILALAGELPMYRTLRPGLSGPDVEQLKQTLRRLGLNPGGDDRYTATTGQPAAEGRRDHGRAPRPGELRRDVVGDVCVIVGLLGGLVGTAVGVLTTVVVSATREWTPLLDYRLALLAPVLDALIGLLAGTYPAWRAAAIEPIAALRA